ncbi:interleukin-15 isoform X1 [Arapaima gigas]
MEERKEKKPIKEAHLTLLGTNSLVSSLKEWFATVQRVNINIVIGCSAVMALPMEQLMLKQALQDVNMLNQSGVHNGLMLNTPFTDDIEACCSTSALSCFVENLHHIKTTTPAGPKVKKTLIKNLQKKIVEKLVRNCDLDQIQKTTCRSCASYEKRDTQDFLKALQTLLQMTMVRLNSK